MQKKLNLLLFLVFFCAIFSVFQIGMITELARFLIAYFILGYLTIVIFGWKENILSKSIVMSILLTTVLGQVLGMLFPLDGADGRLVIAFIPVALLLFLFKTKKAIPEIEKEEVRDLGIVFIAIGIPFLILFSFNPNASLISDGWWHCSVYNNIDKLPAENPWYSGENTAYPVAYEVYLKYASGGGSCIENFNFFAVSIFFATSLCVYLIALELLKKRNFAVISAISFLYLSHLGGLFFLYDLATKLPALGVDGFMDFLKSVHGPQSYYAALNFLGANALIPFQQAINMSGFYIFAFIALCYFLLRRKEFGILLTVAVLFLSNPVLGAFGAILTFFYILSSGINGENLTKLVVIGIFVLLLCSSYIIVLSQKSLGGNLFHFDPVNLFWILVSFSPAIMLTQQTFKTLAGEHKNFILSFIFAGVVTVFTFRLGLTYLPIVGVFILSIGTATFFSKILEFNKDSIFPILLAGILIIPTILVLLSYGYYKVPLSDVEVGAADWIEKNTPKEAVFLQELDINITEQKDCDFGVLDIHNYVTVFAGRKSYFGDPGINCIYGQNVSSRLEVYLDVFDKHQFDKICKLNVDYVYIKSKDLKSLNCLEKVYDQGIKIYKMKN